MELGQSRSIPACGSMIVCEGGRRRVQGRLWVIHMVFGTIYLGGIVSYEQEAEREMNVLNFDKLHLMAEELCEADEGALELRSDQRKSSCSILEIGGQSCKYNHHEQPCSNRTIYVGNLPGDVREREIEDLFYKFEDDRDAEDAIRGRDGYNFDGYHIRVELAHGGRGSSTSADRHSSYSYTGGRVGGVSRRSEYRVVVTGLPSSASWQDLKDHMRCAGDVCFAQVFRDGRGKCPYSFMGLVGIVDFTNYDDMKYAIRKLDDSEFKNPFARGYIRVREEKGNGGRRRRSLSLSRSVSRSRSHSPSGIKSPSPLCSRSRSFSLSRSPSCIKI